MTEKTSLTEVECRDILINTEEKWLLKVYGDEYAEYKKIVNRCIPWFPKQKRSKEK